MTGGCIRLGVSNSDGADNYTPAAAMSALWHPRAVTAAYTTNLQKPPTAVVLYASSGALGHASLARTYTALLQAMGYEAVPRDILALDRGPDIRAAIAVHFRALLDAPWAWRTLYAHWDRIPGAGWGRHAVLPLRFHRTLQWLSASNPELILTTHALATIVASFAKARAYVRGRTLAAMFNWHIQPFWIAPEMDGYLAVTEKQARGLADCGIPSDRIAVTGIPVDPFFYSERHPASTKENLGLPEAPMVFVMGGGLGWRLRELTDMVGALGTKASVVAAGRWKGPAGAIRLVGDGDVRPYFAAADLFLGKPGISVAEAVAMGVPTVITHPVPGHDEQALPELLAATPAVHLPAQHPLGFLENLIAALPEWRREEREQARQKAAASPRLAADAIRNFCRTMGPSR